MGGTTALCPPRAELSDGGTYQYSKLQKGLWSLWNKVWKKVFEIAGNDDLFLVLNGEPCDGDHHNTHQIWTRRVYEQIDASLTCLGIPAGRAKAIFCTRGTEAHDRQYEAGDYVAKELGAYGHRAHEFIELDLQGNKFHIKHQGPTPGYKDHTEGDAIRRELRDQFYKHIKRGKEPPQYFVWAHYHRKAYATYNVEYKDKDLTLHGYIVPGWQLSTAYIAAKKKDGIFDIGLLVFTVEDGVVKHEWLVDTRDITERIEL